MKARQLAVIAGTALLLANTLASTEAGAAGPDARDIMVKNEEARRIREITSSATITTGLGTETKVKTFTWWRKLGGDSVHFKTLTRFHTPAEIRGEGILIEEREANANEVSLYLPTFKKTRRVEGQSQSSSFMGSVFSYSDIAQPHVDDYRHVFLRTEACPNDARVQCHVITSTPANDNVRERTGYSKTVEWIRVDNWSDHFATCLNRRVISVSEAQLKSSDAGDRPSRHARIPKVVANP